MNDSELLARIREGSVDDFEQVVREHQRLVFSILHRYERDAHLVEDLAQETFIKAWRGLHQFDGRAPFAHWLSRIATRVALDHLRKQRRVRNEVALSELGEDALEWLRGPDHDSELNASQAREILDLAMRLLGPEEQLVITLQEIEGKTIDEISRLTGWSNVATRVRGFRARNKLRKAFEKLEKQR